VIYLGAYTAGTVLPYAVRFHDDTGTATDPTGPGAKLRGADADWDAQTAPVKLDATTGLYGGTVDTAALADGLYLLHVYGTVPTAKTVGTVLAFQISSVDAAIKAKTDTIGALAVTVSSPVAASGAVTLYASDDYDATHGRSIDFTVAVADVPNLAGATVKLKTTQATWTATACTSDGTDWTIVFEPDAADTAAITDTRQNYELEATLADGDVVTLATGELIAVMDIPAVP